MYISIKLKADDKVLKSLGLTERGSCHGLRIHGLLGVGRGEIWPGVVSALVVVVLDIEAGKLGEADSQGAASIVDVLAI